MQGKGSYVLPLDEGQSGHSFDTQPDPGQKSLAQHFIDCHPNKEAKSQRFALLSVLYFTPISPCFHLLQQKSLSSTWNLCWGELERDYLRFTVGQQGRLILDFTLHPLTLKSFFETGSFYSSPQVKQSFTMFYLCFQPISGSGGNHF